ncbi:hypothetical protein ACLI4Z_00085 [Natrialbaceae archaeon A-arb3/5]
MSPNVRNRSVGVASVDLVAFAAAIELQRGLDADEPMIESVR